MKPPNEAINKSLTHSQANAIEQPHTLPVPQLNINYFEVENAENTAMRNSQVIKTVAENLKQYKEANEKEQDNKV